MLMLDISYLAKCFGTFVPQDECLDCMLGAECEEVTDIYRQAELMLRDADEERERILTEVHHAING